MTNTLTWLHLSDLHMQVEERYNLSVVLDALWRDLPAQIRCVGGKLDFIAFTGDIAYSGQARQYELAEEDFFKPLLDVTKLSDEQLFLVPGNHDVDWTLIDLINPQTPASLTDRDKVTALLASDEKRRLLFQPMTNYTQFVLRHFASYPGHPTVRDPPYYYVKHIPVGERSIALIGLNSTWLSGFVKGTNANALDKGNLVIGEKQIADAMREAKDATIRIALMHHPPSWLRDFDEVDTKRWLRAGCEFVLLGHLHDPAFVQEKALGGETITIPAGTVYESRKWLNGYNIVQLSLDTATGKIFLRRYSEQLHEWVRDTQSTGDESDGVVKFELAGTLVPTTTLTPRESPTSLILSKVRPHWLRLGREREVQLVEAFLKQEKEDSLWIWGDSGCGSTEFLTIVRTLLSLERKPTDFIYFDAEDAAFGIGVDQWYFLNRLERWADTTSKIPAGHRAEDVAKRWKVLARRVEGRLVESGHRLVLIFANCHLLRPAIREWVCTTLWEQLLAPLRQCGTRAIFGCEGSGSACPASDQPNKIYLGDFTLQDVERFLRTGLPFLSDEGSRALARCIHSENTAEFLSSPKRVYTNLIAEMSRRGLMERLE